MATQTKNKYTNQQISKKFKNRQVFRYKYFYGWYDKPEEILGKTECDAIVKAQCYESDTFEFDPFREPEQRVQPQRGFKTSENSLDIYVMNALSQSKKGKQKAESPKEEKYDYDPAMYICTNEAVYIDDHDADDFALQQAIEMSYSYPPAPASPSPSPQEDQYDDEPVVDLPKALRKYKKETSMFWPFFKQNFADKKQRRKELEAARQRNLKKFGWKLERARRKMMERRLGKYAKEQVKQLKKMETQYAKFPGAETIVPKPFDVLETLSKKWPNTAFKMECVLKQSFIQRFVGMPELNCLPWHRRSAIKTAYHGTNSRNNNSIKEKGLVVGGTKGVVRAHGAAYGQGIYVSPDLGFAASYARHSFFICMVNTEHLSYKSSNIWVVPREDAVLPCYLASYTPERGLC